MFVRLFPILLGLLLSLVSSAQAQPSQADQYLISVGTQRGVDRGFNRDRAWVESVCTMIHRSLVANSKVAGEAVCLAVHLDPYAAKAIQESRASRQVNFHISYREKNDGSIRFEIFNWAADDTDFTVLSLDISADQTAQQEAKLDAAVRNVLSYHSDKRRFREVLLIAGIGESEKVGIDADGYYFDKQAGKRISFDAAYATYKEETRKQKHYLRATTELAVIVGLWTLKYYTLSSAENRPDWEYGAEWSNWRRRLLFQNWRNDNNGKSTNRDHALAGGGYYWVARSNGLAWYEAFFYSFATSMVWELFCEYKEKPSDNDQIVTPIGGLPIGEVFFQLGDFFHHSKATMATRVFGLMFGGAQLFNQWLNGEKFKRVDKTDELGFRADMWHQFEVYIGYELSQRSADEDGKQKRAALLGVHTQLFKPEDYDKAATLRKLYLDPAFTEMLLQSTFNGERKMDDFIFFVKSALAGYYVQDTKLDEKQRLNGYSFFVGPSTALDYRNTGAENGTNSLNDWYLVVNVLGATMDIAMHVKDVKIRFTLDVHGDFALIRSYAYPEYQAAQGDEGLRTVLTQQGYYFGKGLTTSSGLSANYRGFELGGQIKYHYIDSLEGNDRYQERVTKDINMTDRVLEMKGWLAHPLYGKRVKAVYSAEHDRHTGTMAGYKKGERATRYVGKIVFLF